MRNYRGFFSDNARVNGLAWGAAVLVCTAGFLYGCNSEGQVDLTEIDRRLDETAANLNTVVQNAEAELAAAQASGDQGRIDRAQRTLDTAREYQRPVNTAANTVVLDPATGQVDVTATTTNVAGFLPPPYNIIALIAAPLIAGGLQEFRRRRALRAAESLVTSVDTWMRSDPAVMNSAKDMPAAVKDTVHSRLTPMAVEILNNTSTT